MVMLLSKPAAQTKKVDNTLNRRMDSQSKASISATVRMKLVDANPQPEMVGLDKLPGKSNYFVGYDPKK